MKTAKKHAVVGMIMVAALAALIIASTATEAAAGRKHIAAFTSPSALSHADTSGVSDGFQAWVVNQGTWTLLDTCPDQCDGSATCVPVANTDGGVGDGGTGCWVRSTGGLPGAQLTANWYVAPDGGSDVLDCRHAPGEGDLDAGEGPCASISEVLRRIGPQPIPPDATPQLYLVGDDGNESPIFNLQGGLLEYGTYGGFLQVNCSRAYNGYAGTIVGYTPWDGAAYQEGIATVSPAPDAGSGNTFGALNGFWLEDQTGDNAGCGVIVGDLRDAGTDDAGSVSFSTPGCEIPTSFIPQEPAVGDAVLGYALNGIGTCPTCSVAIGGIAPVFVNCALGNLPHSVQVANSDGDNGGADFESCWVRGLDVEQAATIYANGSTLDGNGGGVHFYGRAISLQADMITSVAPRHGGQVQLADNVLIAGPPISGATMLVGCSDGWGEVGVYGPTALSYYKNDAVRLCDASHLTIYPGGGSLWAWGGPGSASNVAFRAEVGTILEYGPGSPPAVTGAHAASPFAAGSATSATLPLWNVNAGIVPAQ